MADQPSARRRFRFRLRTLMIGVTLVAILCGAAMWVVRDRERLMHERDEAHRDVRAATRALDIERLNRLLAEEKAAHMQAARESKVENETSPPVIQP